MKNPRILFEWQRSRSAASRKGWETRWERGEAVGPKGRDYLSGAFPGGPAGDRSGEAPKSEIPYYEEDYFDDYADVWDFEDEY